MKVTIPDLIQFVLRNRRGKAFKGWTPQQIGWRIERALNNGGLAMAVNDKGAIVGLCCATPDHEKKVLHVDEILTTWPQALSGIIQKYKQWFDGFEITARRRGKQKLYRTGRLVHLLSRQ